MSTFDFSNLGPDQILDAIESIGIYPESGLLALNSYENRVYQFTADDRRKYVVKFYRPNRWSDEQIQEEHDFAFELQQQDIPVVPPLKFNEQSLFHHNGHRFCLYQSLGGRMFELDNLDQLEWLGRLLGRMHKVSQSRQFSYRQTINFEQEFNDSVSTLKGLELLPDYLKSTFFHDLSMMTDLCLEKLTQSHQIIRLHGDCHAGNILLQRDDLASDAVLVDLDDCINGPAIQDLWMMLSGDRQNQLLQLDTMVCAYEEFHEFNHNELVLIEPLRARRMVNYMAWIAKRWQDPAFPRNFSWFATDKYWEQQVLAMKEQISALSEPSLKLLP
ncbi:MAG: serine/threonine protein kinase [Gammaproteobacteria bacterium]|nr:serine/threonine protein kinase [Gammaproteobacteria bacterium]